MLSSLLNCGSCIVLSSYSGLFIAAEIEISSNVHFFPLESEKFKTAGKQQLFIKRIRCIPAVFYGGLFDGHGSNQLMTSVRAALVRLQGEDKQQQPAAPWRRHRLLSEATLNDHIHL